MGDLRAVLALSVIEFAGTVGEQPLGISDIRKRNSGGVLRLKRPEWILQQTRQHMPVTGAADMAAEMPMGSPQLRIVIAGAVGAPIQRFGMEYFELLAEPKQVVLFNAER